MRKSEPELDLSQLDLKLVALLSKLLLESADNESKRSNLYAGIVPVSREEAKELLLRFERVAESKSFRESLYFIEGITSPHSELENKVLRNIYLANRKKRGRARILASARWIEFQARLGLINSPKDNPSIRSTTKKMDFGRFLEMEAQALLRAGVHPRVISLLIQLIVDKSEFVENARCGSTALRHGFLQQKLIDPFISWGRSKILEPSYEISKEKAAGAMLIIVDASVLFTTRDWDVTGTLSGVASAAMVFKPEREK